MSTVHVSNIGHEISEKEVKEFFSFCGKITNLSITPTSDASDSTKSASVTFEKETAAKTALLLDNTNLGKNSVKVTSAASLGDLAGGAKASEGADEDDLRQEDKPRSRIVAEYLAHGYVLSDSVLQRAISLDNQHGISNRFTDTLKKFDSKYQATDKARGIDNSYGISQKAAQGWAGLNSYFEKAIGTPTGQKLHAFYQNGNKQVLDIHNEARRLADLRTGKGTKEYNEKTLTQVPGTNETKCQCGGNDGVCACESGKCACSGCAKSSHPDSASAPSSGAAGGDTHTATGNADSIAASANVPPLTEKS